MEKKYQIFISSTYEDLKEERKKVQDTILSMYQFPIGMEMFSAADKKQWEIIRETIDSSDYYVLIIGHRYGSVIDKGKYAGISYTQKEFRYALKRKVPVLVFLIDDKVAVTPDKMEQDDDKRKKLKQFIEEVKNGRTVQWWTSKDDLAKEVSIALSKEISKGKRPGWTRMGGDNKSDKFKSKEVLDIINRLPNSDILEFEMFIKYVKNVQGYRIRFTNKYVKYINDSNLSREQYMTEKGLTEKEFYSRYYSDFECEWYYIGQEIEKFYTKMELDFSILTSKEKLSYDSDSGSLYNNFLIQDAWEELEKIEDDRKFVYGVYVLSRILQGKKQELLRKDFNFLLGELINQNYFNETEDSSESKDEKEYSNKKKGIISMPKDNVFRINARGGQVNIANGNATINATQNNGVGASELDDILKGITESLSKLKKEEADEIADIVEMAKEELTKPEPKASRLRNCLTLIVPMLTVANGIPTLATNLEKLQEIIVQFIK